MPETTAKTAHPAAGEAHYCFVTQYDKRTLYALNDLVSRTTRRRSYRLRKAFLLVLGVLGVLSSSILMLIFDQLETSEQIIAIGGLLVGVIALVEAVFLKRIGAWNTRRMLPKGRVKHVAYLDDTGAGSEEEDIHTHYEYSAFTSAYESQEYFYLLLDQRHAMALDKAGLTRPDGTAGEELVGEVRDYLSQKLSCPLTPIRQKLPKKK